MPNSVTQFYDQLANDYALIFQDWDTAVFRQGEVLNTFIRAQGFAPPLTVLDCTCGIGTQAIGLAQRGYTVRGTDISPASIEQARANAQRLGAAVVFSVADVRQLTTQVEGQYALVVLFDNGLPHLIDDADLRLAAGSLYAKAQPGGGLIASIRDYDQAVQDKPTSTRQRVYDANGERRVIFQVWDWAEDSKT